MSKEDDDAQREHIRGLLLSGLETEVEPFPSDQLAFQAILDELREADGDLVKKLVIGGFLDRPYGAEGMRCLECMYYLIHRRWCDLPELSLPVEPDWYCRLWRI